MSGARKVADPELAAALTAGILSCWPDWDEWDNDDDDWIIGIGWVNSFDGDSFEVTESSGKPSIWTVICTCPNRTVAELIMAEFRAIIADARPDLTVGGGA